MYSTQAVTVACRRAAPFVLLVLAAGCAGGKYPVEGRVVWSDGTPATELAGYGVEFNAPEAKVSATGVVKPDGSFELGTDKPGDGVLPATYKVSIAPPPRDDDTPAPKPLLPRKYEDSETSGLTETIERGKKVVTLKVERIKR